MNYLKEISLKPEKLVPINEKTKSIAEKVIKGKTSNKEKAKSIYEHTINELTYDKTTKGWGRGDFDYICDTRKGNCTDFHSYFIALCRSVGIPAYFEIGFSIPGKKGEGKIEGYHCWAYFWDNNSWIPVDISEADKHPEMKEYYFGNLTENRLAFSVGRDILLMPLQNDEPINFFIYPYCEINNKKNEEFTLDITYKNF